MKNSTPGCSRPPRRAFIQTEILVGLLIVGALLTTLVIATGKQENALRQFADTRSAVRNAETIVAALQAQNTPDTKEFTTLVLSDPSPLADHAWVQITATVHNRNARLIGLIPTSAIPKEATHANP